jgi:hypothetical protein
MKIKLAEEEAERQRVAEEERKKAAEKKTSLGALYVPRFGFASDYEDREDREDRESVYDSEEEYMPQDHETESEPEYEEEY